MKKIKHYFMERFELLFPIFAITGISLFLLMVRLKFTLSFFYLFLVWNLFLAWIPFLISSYLSHKPPKKIGLLLWSGLWLLFLPNAPYILTDFVHLNHPNSHPIFDGFMLAVFSIAGIICYLFSLLDMEALWRIHFPNKIVRITIFLLPFFTGFGIYLGRFLRWNSWDIIQNPFALLRDIFDIVIAPQNNVLAWGTTLSFGFGLWVLYGFFKKNLSPTKKLV
ncbi:DUF1361 domain-containing protein [Aureisphaera galaxeae]|uniref:DUF1361 domain-containing protein n=1 Tax=Aureisphaera galaxeae TaxID=1538023 RepID=UPI00234FEDDA|nr:DUF1361 domain-containing protein [Aureisphaera galaxeae]MDC8004442.1 DUF1361 domain-containing protein [Aureisphaera galaxeae]